MARADAQGGSLEKTLGVDALKCPRCGGRMDPIAKITDPEAVGKILRAMGLPASPPSPSPLAPLRKWTLISIK
jgi:hypothetical protein